MCRRNSGQSRRKRRICSRILVCSPALRSTTIEEGTVIPPTTRDKLALSGVADRNCRCHSLLQCVRPITWFDLGAAGGRGRDTHRDGSALGGDRETRNLLCFVP